MKFLLKDTVVHQSDILEFYRERYAKPNEIKIGIEWERMGVCQHHKKPMSYLGTPGYKEIMDGLHQKYGWKIEDIENGNILTLKKNLARITTEADGKPEISGSPFCSLFENKKEFDKISSQIDEFSPKNMEWESLGVPAYFGEKDITLAPKKRYILWQKIFPSDWMMWYMKVPCGLHINIDVISHEDMMEKMRTLFRISPFLCAAFAHSPLENGKKTGILSARRRHIFAPDALQGMVAGKGQLLNPEFTFTDWLSAFLQHNIVVLFRENIVLPKKPTSFQSVLENGLQGHHATFFDIDAHIKTHWVDIRPRPGYIEYRALDSLDLPDVMAVAAFIKGLIFSDSSRKKLEEITHGYTEKDFEKMHTIAWEKGIKGRYKTLTFLDVLTELFPHVQTTIEGFTCSEYKKDESLFLDPFRTILERKETPADRFLQEE